MPAHAFPHLLANTVLPLLTAPCPAMTAAAESNAIDAATALALEYPTLAPLPGPHWVVRDAVASASGGRVSASLSAVMAYLRLRCARLMNHAGDAECFVARPRWRAEARRILFSSPMLFVRRVGSAFAVCTVDFLVYRDMHLLPGSMTVQERDRLLAVAGPVADVPPTWQVPEHSAPTTTAAESDCNPASPQQSAPRPVVPRPNGVKISTLLSSPAASPAQNGAPRNSVPPSLTSPAKRSRVRKQPANTEASTGEREIREETKPCSTHENKPMSIPLRLRRAAPTRTIESSTASVMLTLNVATRPCATCAKAHTGDYGCGDYCSESCSKTAGAHKRWGKRNMPVSADATVAKRRTIKRARVAPPRLPTALPAQLTDTVPAAAVGSGDVLDDKQVSAPGSQSDTKPEHLPDVALAAVAKTAPFSASNPASVRGSASQTAAVTELKTASSLTNSRKPGSPSVAVEPAITTETISGLTSRAEVNLPPAPATTSVPAPVAIPIPPVPASAIDIHSTPSPDWKHDAPIEHGLQGEHIVYLAKDVGEWRRGTLAAYSPMHERHLVVHRNTCVPDAWLFLRYLELRFVDVPPLHAQA